MYLFHTHACLQPLSLPTVYALHHSACLAPLLWFLLCFIPGVRLPSASSPSFPAGGDVSSGRFGTPCVVLGCWEVVQVLVGVLCTWEPHQQAVRCSKVFQGTERDIGITHCYLVYSVSQKSTKNLRKTNKQKAKTNKHTHTTPCSDCRICFRWISVLQRGKVLDLLIAFHESCNSKTEVQSGRCFLSSMTSFVAAAGRLLIVY